MEFTFSMGIGGFVGLAVGAILLGALVLLLAESATLVDVTITAVATAVGAFAASEFIVGWRTWEPVIDGVALFPAVIGGVVIGAITAIVVRLALGSGYTPAAQH